MDILRQFDLTGKAAFVTGAGQGLGQAMAIALAQAGAHVVVVDCNEFPGISTVETIKAGGGDAIFSRTDVRSVSELSLMVETLVQKFGKLDIAVVAAGVVGPLFVPATDIQPDQWRNTMSVNLDAVFFTDQVAGRQMIKQGHGGRIINIASMSATVANAGPTYGASKAGVVMITKALAVEWAEYGITVNSISPGTIDTPMSQLFTRDPAVRADLEAKTPLGRIGLPEELGGLVVYLASEASSYFTGHDFIMDGGYTIV